jgi:hypothetical protein
MTICASRGQLALQHLVEQEGNLKYEPMNQLKVSGRLIVDNFYKKFEALYPYLNPALFYPDAIGGGEVDTAATIANARARSVRQDLKGYTPTGEAEVSVTPQTTIREFQEAIEKHFGVRCIMQCRPGPEYKWKAINGTRYKDMTLGEANLQLERDKAQPVGAVRTKGKNLGSQYL